MEPSLKKPSTNSVGNWTVVEDEAILRYVYDKGKGDEHMMWGNLSETLQGRSGKSCRERWFNHLDPKIKRTEWSQEEQWVLFILRNQSSEKWSLISKKLMGRTDNAVKNYWNSRLKKRIDSMQHAVNQHFERKKKQKIMQMTQSNNTNSEANQVSVTDAQSTDFSSLSKEQQGELDQYMERIKIEYLQKILDQVNHQNTEYFENLACEYTLQLQLLQSGQKPAEQGDGDRARSSSDFILLEGTAKSLHEQISFMSKPDLIQMHLNILYKSVTFLSQDRILAILAEYKKTKDQKRKEEEKRHQLQMMMKKSRGRNSAKKDKLNDEEMADESKKAKTDSRSKGGDDASKEDEVNSTGQENTIDRKLKKNSAEQSNQESGKNAENVSPNTDFTKLDTSSALEKAKPLASHSQASNESSYSSETFSQRSGMSERQIRLHKSKTSSGLRRILHKLKKQKRQSRMIEKIFSSQKEKRSESDVIEDPLLVKPTLQEQKHSNSQAQSDNIEKEQSTKDLLKSKQTSSEIKSQSPIKVLSKMIKSKKGGFERVLTRHQQKNALLIKKKITKDINGKIISRTRLQLGKKSLNLIKKKINKAENEFCPQTKPKNFQTSGIPQGLAPNLDQNFMGETPQGPYYHPQMDMNNGYHYQGQNHYDMDNNQMGFPHHVTNNITNNNNYYSNNYNIHYNNVENVTQNFFINFDSSPDGHFDAQNVMPQYAMDTPMGAPFQQQAPSFPMSTNFEQPGFYNQQPSETVIDDYVIEKSPMAHNETSHPYRDQSPADLKTKSKRNSSNSQTRLRKRSTSNKIGQRLRTSNFFNQTMAQIVQGKDRELFPLVDKRKLANLPMDQPPMYPTTEASFNQFETPQKSMNQHKQYFEQEDQSTQMQTPFMKPPAQMPNVTPFNPNMTPNFNQEKRFMNPSMNIDVNNSGMQRFASYPDQKPMPNQNASLSDQAKMYKMDSSMSFNNMNNLKPEPQFGCNQVQFPIKAQRQRLPSQNEFSADIMMKMDKHSSLVSGIEKRMSMISDLPAQNDLSANTIGEIQI